MLSPTQSEASTTENPTTLVLSCIDFRFVEAIHNFLASKGLTRKYDWTALAGASLALASFPQPADQNAFWDQLEISVNLHHIGEVMLFEHQECGAYNRLHPHLSENKNGNGKFINFTPQMLLRLLSIAILRWRLKPILSLYWVMSPRSLSSLILQNRASRVIATKNRDKIKALQQ